VARAGAGGLSSLVPPIYGFSTKGRSASCDCLGGRVGTIRSFARLHLVTPFHGSSRCIARFRPLRERERGKGREKIEASRSIKV
jgi:hypothetical protein